MGATAGMMALQGANTGVQFAAQQQNAASIVSQADFGTKLAALNASDAIARGNAAADATALQTRQTIGAQRAGYAGSGIDANSGTAATVQSDQAGIGALDAQMIRNNAARQAWGYTAQAGLDQIGAENTAANERAQSYSTLLTGAAKTYGIYANRPKDTIDPKSGASSAKAPGAPTSANPLNLSSDQLQAVSTYRRRGV